MRTILNTYLRKVELIPLSRHFFCVVIGGLALGMPVYGQKDTTFHIETSVLEQNKTSEWFALENAPRKEIQQVKLLGMGATNILNTYLSTEKYRGLEMRVLSQRLQQNANRRFTHELLQQGRIGYTQNRSSNSNEIAGLYQVGYGYFYQMYIGNKSLNVKLGGRLEGHLGFIYNNRNSNNPAQALVGLQLSPTAMGTYLFHCGRWAMALNYEVSAPLCGVMFSPNYGQSYYQIFSKGNYDHNIVPTTCFSAPSLRQLLSVDIRIKRSTFRVGYLGDYQQAHVNNIKSHIYTHALVVGYVKQFTIIRL